MTGSIRVEADLTFGVDAGGGTPAVRGTVRADGTHVVVSADRLDVLAGGGADRTLRRLAAAAARQGLTVALGGPEGSVVTVGAVRTSPLQRLLTGSPHVRVESWGAAWRLRRTRGAGVLRLRPPGAAIGLPPATPLPLAPTFRRGRRVATTTHDPRGGGRPQLVFAVGPAVQPGDRQRVFLLPPGVITIGSGADADLRLDGLEPLHAQVRRDEQDEYVLVPLAGETATRVNGAVAELHVLRTGSRIELGPWTMSYWREEYADHGRPYGGRSGGELSTQRPQPVPTYRPPAHRRPR